MNSNTGDGRTAPANARLHAGLRRAAQLSPYLLILLVPGSIVLLPVYAWWLSRRRKRRSADQRPAQLTP